MHQDAFSKASRQPFQAFLVVTNVMDWFTTAVVCNLTVQTVTVALHTQGRAVTGSRRRTRCQ